MSKRKTFSILSFKSYQTKIFFYVAVILAVIYGAGFYFTVREYEHKKIVQEEIKLEGFSKYLKEKFELSLTKKDTSVLGRSIQNLSKLVSIDYAVATNYKRQAFYYYNIDKAEKNIYISSKTNGVIDVTKNIFIDVVSIKSKKTSEAKLYLGYSIKNLNEDIKKVKIEILPYFIGAWLLSILVVLLINIKVFKPLKKIVEVSNEIVDGDHSKRVKIKDKSDIGKIGQAINYLAENLERDESHIAKMEIKLKGAFKEKISELNLEINQRRIAEKSVKQSELQFRLLFDVAPIGMAKTSIKGKISQINNSFCETLGYGEMDLIDNNIENFIVEEDKTLYKKLQKSLLENTNPKKTIEICFQKHDGKVINTLLKTALVEDENGLPIDFILQVIDITVQKEIEKDLILAREKAEESDRLKTAFLAQMSHEIRTPLNVILNTAVILEDDIDAELLDAVNHAGKRLQRTIDLILNMSAIQSGSYKAEFEKIDIDNELKVMVNEYKGLCKEKNLEIEYVKETNNTEIIGDNYTIMQIFQNLIDNAIKYTQKGNVKVILTNGNSDSISVEVKDTGIGISDEYLKNIFKPFSQEDVGHKREFDGNGLGLALVKKYIDLNKAEIFVESKKHQGTTFRVVFKNKS